MNLLSNSCMKQCIVVPATTPTKCLAEYHDDYHPAQLSKVRMSLKSTHSEKNTGNRTASQLVGGQLKFLYPIYKWNNIETPNKHASHYVKKLGLPGNFF